ncbi:hypothetical protein DSM3645_20137 [Blastopirellula marina DSM 3645]|uniref:Uncharacterized protein n=1 Tax=Blastopirellula marina DSM 3645 TaxID=314230 RepID=A4A1B6_9BACT|nr:hypothetical protein DSM3645_20137 [Blastopirellula marina DSM 3645]
MRRSSVGVFFRVFQAEIGSPQEKRKSTATALIIDFSPAITTGRRGKAESGQSFFTA